ncbi:MAG: hypothetical protein WC455_25220 [Dehalococcoidia bacterium]|jgi:hypothetical protein
MTATIEDIEPWTDYSVLKHPKEMLKVRYVTDKGTHGYFDMSKDGATKETILAAVAEDAARVHDVVGLST